MSLLSGYFLRVQLTKHYLYSEFHLFKHTDSEIFTMQKVQIFLEELAEVYGTEWTTSLMYISIICVD